MTAGSLAGSLAGDGGLGAPLPQDLLTLGKGAVYLMRAGYLTLSGSDTTAVANADNPGTRDLTGAAAPPLWLPAGGADGKGAVQFDQAAVERLEVAALTWTTGDRPSLYVVTMHDDVTDETDDSTITLQQDDSAVSAWRVGTIRTTSANNTWRTSATLNGSTPVNDFGAPETEGAGVPHLFEAHAYASGFRSVFDGTLSAAGGVGALPAATTLARFVINSIRSAGAYTSHSAQQVSEAVLSDANQEAEAAEYRNQRIAIEYPTIGAAFP